MHVFKNIHEYLDILLINTKKNHQHSMEIRIMIIDVLRREGCLQRWVQCCRLDLTRGGWAGLKGTLLRQLSPKDAKLKLSEQSKSFDSDNAVYCCSQF